jgi:hypothetical protein
MSTAAGRAAWDTHLAECDDCLAWSIDQALAQTPTLTGSPDLVGRVMRGITAAPAAREPGAAPSRIGVRVAVAAVVTAAVAASPMVISFGSASTLSATHVAVLAIGVVETCIVVAWALARPNTRGFGIR